MSPFPEEKKKKKKKEKIEYFLLNIEASEKLTQNVSGLGTFFIWRVEHIRQRNLAIFISSFSVHSTFLLPIFVIFYLFSKKSR